MKDLPAILNGRPLFKEKLKFYLPLLPKFTELVSDLEDIITSGRLTKGKFLEKLEKKLQEYLNLPYCICVSNATLGLILSIKALKLHNKLILPSFTFISTGLALLWNNIEPVFVDIDISTLNTNEYYIEEAIRREDGKITGMIIPHTFGNPVDVEKILDLADKYNLVVIFDAASAFGAEYKSKKIGSFGACEVFSLSPTKNLVAGEGGFIATSIKDLKDKLLVLREYGLNSDYVANDIGLNARLPEISSVLAEKTLEFVEENIKKKRRLANIYINKLKEVPGISFQEITKFALPAYKDFPIIIDEKKFGLNRDILALALEEEGIPTKKYFYPPLHEQPIFRRIFEEKKINLPNTDYVSKNILCLPIYYSLQEEEVELICYAISNIHKFSKEINSNFYNLWGKPFCKKVSPITPFQKL